MTKTSPKAVQNLFIRLCISYFECLYITHNKLRINIFEIILIILHEPLPTAQCLRFRQDIVRIE